MALLPENADGPAALGAGIFGIAIFVWRFFWGARKDVRHDGAEVVNKEAYESTIKSLERENDRLRTRLGEGEIRHETEMSDLRQKLHESRNKCAVLELDKYRLEILIATKKGDD